LVHPTREERFILLIWTLEIHHRSR
jgi:hypothetical protein